MTIDHGRSASPSGHSRAEPEEVSALRASVPNAPLRGCPRCGHEAERLHQRWSERDFHSVKCGNNAVDCGIWLDSRSPTLEAAAAAWNTRTPPQAEKLLALRLLCDIAGQPFYVELLDEIIAASGIEAGTGETALLARSEGREPDGATSAETPNTSRGTSHG